MDECGEIYSTEPQDTELYKLLSPEMQKAVIEVRKVVEEKLKKVDRTLFYHYTAHDIRHVLRTLSGFCRILESSRELTSITDNQALICLCACLVHDVGMGPITKEEEAWVYKNAGKRDDESVAQQIKKWREDHHERTMEWVLNDDLFSFADSTSGLREAIAQVARGHRKVPLLSDGYFASHQDIAFFAAVLRLGDQMDLSPERLDERLDISDPEPFVRELINSAGSEDEEIQVRETLKNLSKKSWTLQISEDDETTLRLETDVNYSSDISLAVLAALEHLVGDIEKAIEQTKVVSEKLPSKLELEPLPNTVLQNHRLRTHYGYVWKYLSEKVYPPGVRNIAPIREAICNGIDACLLLSPSEQENARVIIHDKSDHIVIEDNGVGMSRSIINDYLMVLGSSYYRSPRFEGWLSASSRVRPDLISQFGIGVFSYLLVSGGYELETCDGKEATHVAFSHSFGLAVDSDMTDRGTKVTIPCPEGKRRVGWTTTNELRDSIAEIFVNPRVTLHILKSDGTDWIINKNSTLDCQKYKLDHCHLIRQDVESSGENPVKGKCCLDFGITFGKNKEACELNSFIVYRKNERFYKSPSSWPKPRSDPWSEHKGYSLLYSGLNLVDEKQPSIPYLRTLYDSLHSYHIPDEHGFSIEVKPLEPIFNSYLDLDPRTVSISLIKTYTEPEHSQAVQEICDQFNDVCKTIVHALQTDVTTPWQIVDRMVHIIITQIMVACLGPDTRSTLFFRSSRDQDILICFDGIDVDSLIGSLLVLDLKAREVRTVSDLVKDIAGSDITIVDAIFDPSYSYPPVTPKDFLKRVKDGIRGKLQKRFRTPDTIVTINGGEIVPGVLAWYFETKGAKHVNLLDTRPYWQHFDFDSLINGNTWQDQAWK